MAPRAIIHGKFRPQKTLAYPLVKSSSPAVPVLLNPLFIHNADRIPHTPKRYVTCPPRQLCFSSA